MENSLKVDGQDDPSKQGLKLALTLVDAKQPESGGSDADVRVEEVGKKRQRDDEDKISAVDKFQAMTVKELQELATLRGFPACENKNLLIDWLCEEEDEVEDKKEKLVIATKKGSTVLDQWLPDEIKNQYHVLQMRDEIYDATLSLADVGDNSNSFYVLQALEMDIGGIFKVYSRWGRVGEKGSVKEFGPYANRDYAIKEFESKFFEMTKNLWSNRMTFVSYPKSYTWLGMDYTETNTIQDCHIQRDTAEVKSYSSTNMQPGGSKIDTRVASFISLICNIGMMKQQQIVEIGYNAEKLPLGKLSKSTILKGYDVLKRISDIMGQANRDELEQLSGEFYTVIPHDFGFKEMREFVIDTPQKLKRKLQMVEALGEIELATKLLKEDIGAEDDLVFSHYKRLRCDLMPLEADSEESLMVVKYLKKTQTQTTPKYTVDVVQVFRLSREGESERFNKYSTTKNRMLLWHGSRLANWTGILSQGLRIAPPEAPRNGYNNFGKGVYFADIFSKSAGFCYANNGSTSAVLVLCEVALGEMEELFTTCNNADELPRPEGKISIKYNGMVTPDPKEAQTLNDGVIVPLGKLIKEKGTGGYNEYIVYNVDQVRMRYLLQLNFNFNQ